MNTRRTVVATIAIALAVTGCGDSESGSVTTADSTSVAPTTTTTTAAPTTTTTAPATTTTTESPATTTSLPGELVEYGPLAGAILAVIGVEPDDVLNVRRAPGIDQDIIATLDPLSNIAVAQGQTRLLPNSAWYEVDVNGTVGWASASFLAQLGETRDETTFVLENAFPRAETLLQRAEEVAAVYVSEEPPSTVTIVDGPNAGDLADLTVDVVGLGDDAVVGLRLHIFAQPDAGGEGWEIKSVEVTALCGRGASDGLCV